ncbi:GNAT family N-acetyltransferase, partial [Burkholderia gladioli]|uniref:GNAT family N-acetyltransferase n=1 Tax=Burkholderia gladioli TaxID=28095 RepID=UPI0010FDCFDB|nr:GNAT family N-acetyltransferase [Burkholderia gladioli]
MLARRDLEDVVLAVLREEMPALPECARDALARFEMHPVVVDNQTAGVVMIDGDEIHIAVLPRGRRTWASRRFIRHHLCALIEKHGRATTTVRAHHLPGLKFCARLGFKPVREEGGIVHMICEATL